MREWFNFAVIVLCICLCFSLVALAEEPNTEEPEIDEGIIDFTFCVKSVAEEDYAHLETDLPIKQLSCLHFKYYDQDGEEQESEIVVKHDLEFDALNALEDIYDAQLPIWEIEYFAGNGYDVIFKTVPGDPDPEFDPYNIIFDNYGFICNENQAEGWRHYTFTGIYPE